MKYLILIPQGEDAVFYNLNEIINITCDYAKNILSKSDIEKNSLKPLDLVTLISLNKGDTAIYRTAGSILSFD